MPEKPAPRTDLHRHLEGSVRLITLLEIAKQYRLSLPADNLPDLQRAVYIDRPTPDIIDLFPRFDWLRSLFVDYDTCRRIAWECLEDADREGLDYVELRFSPLFMAEPHGLDPMGVTSAVCEAWEEARFRLRIQARLIGILSRTYGPDGVEIELQAALSHCQRGISGLDLAGDEARHPAVQFVDHFQRARDAGLRLTAHAGEFAGAESVRQTVELLGVERLGHAVHAVDDPGVLDLLAERQIAVECCPTSNLYTCAVRSLSEHPLPRFLEKGIRATICTDDPTLFGEITLQDEYELAREKIGLDQAQLDQAQRNGWQTAFLSDAERVDRIDLAKGD